MNERSFTWLAIIFGISTYSKLLLIHHCIEQRTIPNQHLLIFQAAMFPLVHHTNLQSVSLSSFVPLVAKTLPEREALEVGVRDPRESPTPPHTWEEPEIGNRLLGWLDLRVEFAVRSPQKYDIHDATNLKNDVL